MTEPAEAALGVADGMRYLREALAWYEAQGDVASTDGARVRLARSLLMSLGATDARELLEPVVERLVAGPASINAAAACNEYGRSYLFTGDYEAGLRVLEQGLVIAEHLGAQVTIAELLVSKMWALGAIGRPREAAALAMGGLDMSQRIGSVVTEFRARMNASNWYLEEDPRRGLDIAATGVELARSVGHGDWAAALAGNASMAALVTGEWDRVTRYRDDLDSAHLTGPSRFAVHGWAWVVDAYRGGDASDVLSRTLAEPRLDAPAQQERGAVFVVSALVRFASGDLDGVAEPALRAYREYPEVEPVIAMLQAARAATLRRDVDGIRVLDVLPAQTGDRGAWLMSRRRLAGSAIDWLERRPGEPEQVYREAIATFRAMGLGVEVALTELEMLALGGDALPDQEALRAEAVGILRELGVRPLLERLSDLVDTTGESSPARSDATPVGAVSRPS